MPHISSHSNRRPASPSHNPSNHSLIVPPSLRANISLHLNPFDNDRLAILTRNPDRSLTLTNTARNLKKVILSALRRFPRAPAVGGDFHLRRAAVGVDDLRREPVRRHAGFGVDGQRAGDFGAGHELVARVDDAFGGVGEGGEGVAEEV